ncbi:MAG: sugar phosphate nucleotidyltransferase [Candidatus Micrarchaeota archaeon]|nr:sugar phosphate nucleotidyltransferase [Candidatus Micrarchaeota archaeon]MCX8154739.1 sugar phosphate nucleotidyltransferase [Candidatus Micrarchaeota archaeon]
MYRVVVLAGGKGQRLRPYTENLPKPLLKIGSKTLIEYVMSNIKRAGFREIIIATGHLGEQIEGYLGNRWNGIKIEYYREKELEGTAGCLVKMREVLDENFIVVMGDHITTIDLKELYNTHRSRGAMATITLKNHNVIIEYGVASISNNHIERFEEKPTYTFYINTGIYALNRAVLDHVKVGDDFAKDVFPRLLKLGYKLDYYLTDEFWADIGRVKDYEFFRDQLSMIEVFNILK